MERTGHQKMRMAKPLPNGPRSEGILRLLQSFVVHEGGHTDFTFFKMLPTSSITFLPPWTVHDSVHQHVQ